MSGGKGGVFSRGRDFIPQNPDKFNTYSTYTLLDIYELSTLHFKTRDMGKFSNLTHESSYPTADDGG